MKRGLASENPRWRNNQRYRKGCALEGREKGARISRPPLHSSRAEGPRPEREFPNSPDSPSACGVLHHPRSPPRLPIPPHPKPAQSETPQRYESRREYPPEKLFSAAFPSLTVCPFLEGGWGWGERGRTTTPLALGRLGELETRAPSSGLRSRRSGGASVRSQSPSRAPPGRTLWRHFLLARNRGFSLAKPRCTPGYPSVAPLGRTG